MNQDQFARPFFPEIPSFLRDFFGDFWKSCKLVFSNKWLFNVIVFFSLVESLYTNILKVFAAQQLSPSVFSQSFNAFELFLSTSLYFQIVLAAQSTVHLFGSVVSKLPFASLLGFAGTILAVLILLKHVKKTVFGSSFIKKCLYGVLAGLALFVLLSVLARSTSDNSMLRFYVAVVGQIDLILAVRIFQTLFECVLVLYVVSLFLGEQTSLTGLFQRSHVIFKPLFLFKIALLILSTYFIDVAFLHPFAYVLSDDTYHSIHSVHSVVDAVHTILRLLFVLVPLVLALNPEQSLSFALGNSLRFVRRNLGAYIFLTLFGIVGIMLLAFLWKLSSFAINPFSMPGIVLNIVYDILTGFFAMIFSVMMFKSYLRFSGR